MFRPFELEVWVMLTGRDAGAPEAWGARGALEPAPICNLEAIWVVRRPAVRGGPKSEIASTNLNTAASFIQRLADKWDGL